MKLWAIMVVVLGLAACQPTGNAGVSIGTDGVKGRVGAGVAVGNNVTVGVGVGL